MSDSHVTTTDSHSTTIRVRYSETDAMRFLHHANYVTYLEIARTELFRTQGGNYAAMEQRGFFFVVVKVEVNYKSPAHYDDTLTVTASLKQRTGAKLMHEYQITRNNTLIATATTTLACINQSGEVQRITDELLFG